MSMQGSARSAPARRLNAPAASGWKTTFALLALLALAALYVADYVYDPARFRIEAVEVNGRFKRVDGARIKAVVERALDGNYFSIQLPAVEARVERLPWVFSVSVRRRWPDRLVVEAIEVQPVAKWGRHHWIHSSGDLVARELPEGAKRADQDKNNVKPLLDQGLPTLSGPASQQPLVWQSFRRWSAMFAANGLSLDGLELDARGLWYLRLSLSALAASQVASHQAATAADAVDMIVHRDHAGQRIARFVEALPRLITEFPFMRSIDLRYPNGFAIGWRDASARARQLAAAAPLAAAATVANKTW